MMKKVLTIICCLMVALSCMAIAGCGAGSSEETTAAGSQYIGTWKATDMDYKDEEATVEEVLGGEFIMVLHEDGTADITMSGDELQATWSETDEGIRTDGDLKLDFLDEDGALSGKIIGIQIYLTMQ